MENHFLDASQIEEIVTEVEAGMICYIHKEKKVVNFIPEQYFPGAAEPDPWEELFEDVEENPDQYWEIRKMDSRRSYRMMERFASQLDNEKFQEALFEVLNMRKPFRNFRNLIDNSGEFRDQWFEFRRIQNEKYVLEQLDFILQDEEEFDVP